MRARITGLLSAATVAVVVASGTTAMLEPAGAAARPLTKPPKVQKAPSVAGKNFVPRHAGGGAAASGRRYKVAFHLPAATAARRVTLPGARSGRVGVGGTPVTLGPVTVAGKVQATRGSATVRMLSQSAARKSGVDGVLFQVTVPPATTPVGSAEGRMPVTVDYSAFKDAFGGDWASRLRLVSVPQCALNGQTGAACPAGEELPTTNVPGKTLTASVPLSATASTMTFAAEAAPSGDTGDFSATPLQASSAWSTGLQTGNFSWSYPIPTVPVPSGLAPDVAVQYSSQSVDGRTQASNNQTSWLGEGQSLETGFIERSYAACADSQSAGNKTGDLCWKTDNATVSFQGQSGKLIHIPGTNEWRLQDDEGWRIRRLTDTTPGNGDDNGEYWELTDQDGTRYYFGRERRFSGDTENTESAWTVPVFGDDAGEPCHDTNWCQQAWRWNLDYVVDQHGNTISYFYDQETNHYGLNNNASQPTYVRGGHLVRIDYGQVAGSLDVPAAARVVFGTAERCLPTDDFDCAPDKLTQANASHWPDVPFDQICTDEDSCRDVKSPAFFSRKRLVSVTTQVRDGATYDTVDRFAFGQSFPQAGDGTGRSLWLDSITRTGLDGGSQSTPAVLFHGVQMDNRVLLDGAAPLIKWRLSDIQTETGGSIVINYSAKDCAPGDMPAGPAVNQRRCFPVYWSQTEGAPPTLNWFHKYVVTGVTEADMNGTVTPVRTRYTYSGGGAWHYDDNEITKPKYRTYGEWRGYDTVEVSKGDPSEAGTALAYDKYHFLRGMDGDRLPDGPDDGDAPDQRNVTVADDDGGTITDLPRFNGFQREHIQRNGASGPIVSAEINDPWRSDVTADDGDDQARILRTGATHTRRQLVGTNNYIRTTVSTDYDQYGLPTAVHDAGDDTKSNDSTCSRTWYARDVSQWLLTAVSRSQVVSVPCSATAAATDVVSDVRYSFDRGAYGDAPIKGDVTTEETLSGTPGSGTWKTTSQMAYDLRGRVVSTTDGLGNTSTVTYTPSGEGTELGPVTQQVSTNAKSQSTTTTFSTGRGQPLSVTDVANRITSGTYDALGRLTAVWRPGHLQGTDPADVKYGYSLSNATYSYVSTQTLLLDGTYSSSYDIYDGLLRTVETQKPAANSAADRVLTTIKYNSRGQQVQTLGPYSVTGSVPSGVYYSPALEQVWNNHKAVYDSAGRQVSDIYQPKNDEALGGWHTNTSYDADRTMTNPPAGGTPTTEVFDVRGRTVQLIDHLGTSTAATTTQSTWYTYDAAGRMLTMKDHKGDLWTWSYDQRGNQVTVKDPDKGAASMTYDNNDQLQTTTDSRNLTTRVQYDALGRKVGLYDGPDVVAAKARATWEYDSLMPGKLTKSTRYQTPGDTSTLFVSEITGYTPKGEPTGTKTTVPSITGLTDTLAGTYTTAMTYNADGTLKTKTLPTSYGLPTETVQMSYDRLGQPITMGGRDSVVGATTYSPYGEMLQVTTGTTAGKYTYQTWYLDEGTRRLTRNIVSNQAVSGSISDTTYGYDAAGNVKQAADAAGTKDLQCFSYDYLQELTEAWTIASGACATPSQTVMGTTAGAYWSTYSYDALGNRTKELQHAKTGSDTSYTYAYPTPGATTYPNGSGVGGPHAVSTVTKAVGGVNQTPTSYQYDAAGNMTTRGTQTNTWDAEGALATTKTGTAIATNVYDADGNRLLRRDGSGTATLYLDSTEIRLTGTTKTSQRWYTFGGKVVATRTVAGGVQNLAADYHDTGMVQVTANTGTYVKRRFDAFGNARLGAGTGTWTGDRGFLDKSTDTTGLTQVGRRYYDSALGRFISVDPLLSTDDPGSLNGYAYAGSNPATQSDPTGMCPVDLYTGQCASATHLNNTNVTPTPSNGTTGSSDNSPPATNTTSSYEHARAIMKAILASSTSTTFSIGLAFHDQGDKFFNTVGRHADGAWLKPWSKRADRAWSAFRLRTGTYELPGRHAALRAWEKVDWDKVGKVFDNKLAKRAGLVGTAIAAVGSYSEHRSDGETRTEAALKTGIETSFAAGGAAALGTVGGVCGPAAPACSTGLGIAGAYLGDKAGKAFTGMFDSQIGWTAGKLDDIGGAIKHVDYSFWN